MSPVELMTFAITLLIAVTYPGPTVAALVARVVSRGLADVWPFMAAVWIGEILWLSAAVLGLAALATTLGTVFVIIKYAGAAYLLGLAWTMWFARSGPEAAAVPPPSGAWRMFGAGLAVSLGNPKNMLFYMTLLPNVVSFGHVDLLGWAKLCLIALGILAAVDTAWALAAQRARRLLRSPRAVRIASRASASMMAGAAIAVATK